MTTGSATAIGFLLGLIVALVLVWLWYARQEKPGNDTSADYRRLLMEIDDAIAFREADGTVTFSNESFRRIVGVDPVGEDIGTALSSVPELAQRVRDSEGGVAAVEAGGETRYYDVSLYSTDVPAQGQLILFHDVTHRYEHQRQLEAQNERLDQFASLVSHDLRNPLDVAMGRTNAAAEAADDPALRDHLDSAQCALQRMKSIITNVLVLARRGEDIAEATPTSLEAVSERAWRMVETDQATLQVRASVEIEANTEGLVRVFENLFRNAVEHAGPEVTVSVGPLADGTGFYVEDDGPGIPKSLQGSVCEPGEASDNGGTGLGLAIVEAISEAHGWEVTICESADGGARFEFSGVTVPSGEVVSEES